MAVVIIIIICHHSSSVLWAARGSIALQILALTCIDPVLNQKPFLRFLGFYFVWIKELWAALESPLCREVVRGCLKSTAHGLRHLPELVLSVKPETQFLSRSSTWRAPEASKGLTVTPTAHQPCTRSRLQHMKQRKNSADLKSEPPISSHPPGLRWHSHTTTVGSNSLCQGLGSKAKASSNPWVLKENDHKTIYYFWTKTLIRLSCIGSYHWYSLSFLI